MGFDPVTVGALAAGGGLIQFIQAAQTGRFQRKLGERNAAEAIARAGAEEERFRRSADRTLASQFAVAAAQGGGLGGSVLDIQADLAAEAEESALLIRAGGAAEAARARFGGRIQQREAILGGFGSLLGGASRAGSLLVEGR